MKSDIFRQMRVQMDAHDALTQRTIAQLQQQNIPQTHFTVRYHKVIAVMAVTLVLLGCAFLHVITLPAHVGDIVVTPVYDSTGAQALASDGTLIWMVRESDDIDLAVGTKVVVDETTGAFAIYAPPVSNSANTQVYADEVAQSDVSDAVTGQYGYPIYEYQSYELVLRENGDIWANRYYASQGTSLYAVATGTVISTEYNGVGTGYGLCVIIEQEDGRTLSYTHCDAVLVAVGDTVESGQEIARVGCSGYCSEPMCDMILCDGETTLDLQDFLDLQE